MPPSHAVPYSGTPPLPSPTTPLSLDASCRASSSVAPRPGDQERGPSLAGPRQAQEQLAPARPRHHPQPSAGRNRSFTRSALRRTEEVRKTHVARLYFKCFRCFMGRLQLFYVDVTKVDLDVAYVAMVVHVRCKGLFPMFRLCFRMYDASVFYLDV